MIFYLIRDWLGIFLSFIFIFIYLFFIKINFFPYYAILPLVLIGLLIFFKNVLKSGIPKDHLFFIIIILFFLLFYIISYLFNGGGDFYFVKEVIVLALTYYFPAFFIKYVFCKFGIHYDYNNITKFLSITISIQLILSLIAYVNPTFFNLIFSLINIGLEKEMVEGFNEGRMVGIGAAFFGSGIINSIALVLIASILGGSSISKNNNNIYFVCYLIIASIGMISSRTTIVGIFISLFIFLLNQRNMKFFVLVLIVILFSPLFFNFLSSNDRLVDLLDFGFKFLYDFNNSQASSSLSVLKDMFKVYPSNFKTWLIGDALYKNEFGGYYKDIDIGFLRIIFSSGLIGLFLFVTLHFFLIKRSFVKMTFLQVNLLLLLFVLNLKGVAHFYPFLFLYFLINKSQAHKI